MADEHVTPPELQEFEEQKISEADENKILDRLFNFFSDEKNQKENIFYQIDWDKTQPLLYNLDNIKETIIRLLSDPLVHTRRMKFMLLALCFMAYIVKEVRKGNGLRDTCNELGKLGCNIISLIKKVHPHVCLEPQKYKEVVTSMLSCIFACLQHAYRLGHQMESHRNLLKCMDSFSTKSLACLVDKHEKPKVPKSWFTDPEPVGLGREVLEQVTKLVDIDSDLKIRVVNIIGQRGMGKSTLAKRVIKHMCCTSPSSTKKKSLAPFSCFVHLDFYNNNEFSEKYVAKMQENMMKQIFGVDIYVHKYNNDGKKKVEWILHNISSPSFILIFFDNVSEFWQVYHFIDRICKGSLKSKLRIIITSQQPVSLKYIEKYVIDKLDIAQSVMLFKNSILSNNNENGQRESKIKELFWGEKRAMERVAQLCNGIPGIIVSTAHHLKDNRTASAYGDVIQSIKKADMSKFKYHYANDLSLSDIILSLYNLLLMDDKLVFEEICLFFDECDWDMLCYLGRRDILNRLEGSTMIKKSADGRVKIHNKLLKSLIVNKAQDKEERRHLVVDIMSIHKSTSLNLVESYMGFNHMEGLFLKRRIHPIMNVMPSLDLFSESLRLLHTESGIKIKFNSQTTVFNHLEYLNIQWNPCYDSKSPLPSWMFPNLKVLSTSKSMFQDFNSLSKLRWLDLDSVISICDFSRFLSVLHSLKVLRLLKCNNLTSMTFPSKNLRILKKSTS